MTPEEILLSNIKAYNGQHSPHTRLLLSNNDKEILTDAMQEYADQETAELKAALQELWSDPLVMGLSTERFNKIKEVIKKINN